MSTLPSMSTPSPHTICQTCPNRHLYVQASIHVHWGPQGYMHNLQPRHCQIVRHLMTMTRLDAHCKQEFSPPSLPQALSYCDFPFSLSTGITLHSSYRGSSHIAIHGSWRVAIHSSELCI